MYTTDPVADLLTRIRNAKLAKKTELLVPYSNLKYTIAKIILKNGFIGDVSLDTSAKFKNIKITLPGTKELNSLVRMSKPGRRMYVPKDKLPVVLSGYGIAIVSTSRGVMTGYEAHKLGIGGELICKVW